VMGIGVNVSMSAEELPVPTATSLALAGSAHVDRNRLLVHMLRRLALRYDVWNTPSGDPNLPAAYAERCSTIGRAVRVELAGGDPSALTGTATGIDEQGRLVVAVGSDLRHIAAGDVVHVG
jgi:BirA family transcriptional regulator, biotin operon repressor / biotin---[acetyl-CoA-carboxylase] ligase